MPMPARTSNSEICPAPPISPTSTLTPGIRERLKSRCRISSAFAQINAPGLPNVITETGYNTDTSDTYSGVDQTVQAKFTLDTLVDAYKMGVAKTYLYELLDEQGHELGPVQRRRHAEARSDRAA